MTDLLKQENGLVYENNVLNRHLAVRLLKRQTIHRNVQVGNCVYYDDTSSLWRVSSNRIPHGLYIGYSMVALTGYVDGLSGLTPGFFHWMKSDGSLTKNYNESYGNIKIGFAMSETELLLDIDVVGDTN
jgi:hypothetical protein